MRYYTSCPTCHVEFDYVRRGRIDGGRDEVKCPNGHLVQEKVDPISTETIVDCPEITPQEFGPGMQLFLKTFKQARERGATEAEAGAVALKAASEKYPDEVALGSIFGVTVDTGKR